MLSVILEWRGLASDSDKRLIGWYCPASSPPEALDIGCELEVDRAGDLHACEHGEMERGIGREGGRETKGGGGRGREGERNGALAGRESDRVQGREGEE